MTKLNFMLGGLLALLVPSMAFAEEAAAAATGGIGGMAKGFAVGVAALGCALGQGKIVSAALDGIGRNPGAREQIFTPMLLGVVFVETLLIFTLVAARFAL